jgi:glyoxylate/hydroxypyruvate reductase A
MKIIFAGTDDHWSHYQTTLPAAFKRAEIDTSITRDLETHDADYIVFAPNGPLSDFTPYTKANAVLNLWAGVETIVGNVTLTQPLVRMIDHGLTQGMVEWVSAHSLRYHVGMDAHIHGQDGTWRNTSWPPLAETRRVTVLGMGTLGTACAQALRSIGFRVTGWSRTQKTVNGINCLSGDAGLDEALRSADILILLLPLTDETNNLLDAQKLALLPDGAFLLNPGRGPLIDDEALLAALDQNIAHATLDVFNTEPLPTDHPYWAHRHVTVTPHIASVTRAATASDAIARNIIRIENGQTPIGLVDRTAGY